MGAFTARSWDRMGICMIPEKEAEKRLLWADYGHYMGLNLGLFWQIKRYNRPDFLPLESDGFTGVFLGRVLIPSYCDFSPPPSLCRESLGRLIGALLGKGIDSKFRITVSGVAQNPTRRFPASGITRGGVGATAPITSSKPPAFAKDFRKSPDREWKIPEKGDSAS